MSWTRLAGVPVLAVLITASGGQPTLAQDRGVPTFAVDPSWPALPTNWVLGQVSSVTVDGRDHVWVLHRPRTVPDEQQANAARPRGGR